MRITADLDKCEGLGDQVNVLDDSPPESERAHVHAAVQACPVQALSLQPV